MDEIREPGEAASEGLRLVEAGSGGPGSGPVKIENHYDSDSANNSVVVLEEEVEDLIKALVWR